MVSGQGKVPEWYWSRGLHDAKIISATVKQSNWNPDDNCLILELDCDSAVMRYDITQIRFYNFKIKTTDFDINSLNDGWWMSDELFLKGNFYLLELKYETSKRKTRRFEMTFNRAEVIRG